MKQLRIILLIIIAFTFTLTSCGINTNDIIKIQSYEISLEKKEISVDGGIILDDAREIIVDYIINIKKIKYIDEKTIVKEITSKEVWENDNVQLYIVYVDYALVYAIAIIENNELVAFLNGMRTNSVFIADLDGDEIYEVYSNISSGSGMISLEVLGYNIANGESYHLAERGKKDFTLYLKENQIFVDISKYPDIDDFERTGKLSLNINNSNQKLYVEE